MADTKISALAAATTMAATDEFPANQAGTSRKVTLTQARGTLNNASTVSAAATYAADTYLANSSITIPTAGGWLAGAIYRCGFDILKTAAGTAAFTVTIRMGTLGTTGDASVLSMAFGAGTAAVDAGWVDLEVVFRSVGSGTSAVIQGVIHAVHNLAATGLWSTGASGIANFNGTSAGFASTTQTIIGISINGGASFSGTNTLVRASLDKVF